MVLLQNLMLESDSNSFKYTEQIGSMLQQLLAPINDNVESPKNLKSIASSTLSLNKDASISEFSTILPKNAATKTEEPPQKKVKVSNNVNNSFADCMEHGFHKLHPIISPNVPQHWPQKAEICNK